MQKSNKTTLILSEIRTKDERAASLPVGQMVILIDKCDQRLIMTNACVRAAWPTVAA